MADRETLVEHIYGWLDRGYPSGVPPQDRFAVGALLRNRLSDTELTVIVRRMAESHRVDEWMSDTPPTDADIARYIRKVVDGNPTHDDIRRVTIRLAAAGWPLAGLDDDEDDEDASTKRRQRDAATRTTTTDTSATGLS